MPNEQGLSKRQVMREKRQREQRRTRNISITAIVIGALLIVGFIVIPPLLPKPPVGPIATPAATYKRSNVDFNAVGSANAPITITEYSDFQCPFCMHFWRDTEEQLVSTYVAAGKVRLVYRSYGNFLSDNIQQSTGVSNSESQDAAAAAYCAGDQGKFWEYHDILFANQTGEGVGDFAPSHLTAIAEKLGLNLTAFNSCFNDGKYKDRVVQDGIDGKTAGIQATPSFVLTYTLNGQVQSSLIEGAQPFSDFQTAIEAALKALGQ